LPASELLVLGHQPRPYRLPRRPGAGRVVAPALPFSDTAAVRSAVGGGLRASAIHPQLVTVSCGRSELAGLADRLAQTGVGGLRLVVQVDGVPAVTPAHVRALATAGVAALDIAGDTTVDAAALPTWIELNKAALGHGLPLAWSGLLPAAVSRQLAHLVPARNQPDWQRRWRYAMLGWRKGPSFATVLDSRTDARQLTVALPVVTDLFGPDLDQPVGTADADPEILTELTEAGLVLIADGAAVWLPYRIRRWPVSSPPVT
jgi:Family of unknown function (DUF5825)